MDPDAVPTGRQVRVAQVHHVAPALRRAQQAVDAGAAGAYRRGEPELFEHIEAGGLDQQAGPDRAGRGDALEQGDAVAGARQEQRCRHACRAGADDSDGMRARRARIGTKRCGHGVIMASAPACRLPRTGLSIVKRRWPRFRQTCSCALSRPGPTRQASRPRDEPVPWSYTRHIRGAAESLRNV